MLNAEESTFHLFNHSIVSFWLKRYSNFRICLPLKRKNDQRKGGEEFSSVIKMLDDSWRSIKTPGNCYRKSWQARRYICARVYRGKTNSYFPLPVFPSFAFVVSARHRAVLQCSRGEAQCYCLVLGGVHIASITDQRTRPCTSTLKLSPRTKPSQLALVRCSPNARIISLSTFRFIERLNDTEARERITTAASILSKWTYWTYCNWCLIFYWNLWSNIRRNAQDDLISRTMIFFIVWRRFFSLFHVKRIFSVILDVRWSIWTCLRRNRRVRNLSVKVLECIASSTWKPAAVRMSENKQQCFLRSKSVERSADSQRPERGNINNFWSCLTFHDRVSLLAR